MQMTSDYAQKLIKKLEEEKSTLRKDMNNYSTYVVGLNEGDLEELRPEFDFKATVEKIAEIDAKIMKIKHARNIFNTTTVLEGTEMTVDEALMRMAMLNANYRNYASMGSAREKTRKSSYGDNVEYVYTNYDIAFAKELGDAMYNELLEIQEKLNLLNSTVPFEAEI